MEEATITLQGKGAIHVVPDVTRLEVKIEQWFADYGKAYEQARENSAWMVKILEYNKKPGKLAKTVLHIPGEVRSRFPVISVHCRG